MLPVKLWRMSSGFGPLSRSRLLGSERPGLRLHGQLREQRRVVEALAE